MSGKQYQVPPKSSRRAEHWVSSGNLHSPGRWVAFVKRIVRELTEEEKATLTNWFWRQYEQWPEKRVDSAIQHEFYFTLLGTYCHDNMSHFLLWLP
jgi:hypothetical protein